MELYEELLAALSPKQSSQKAYWHQVVTIEKLLDMECYQALKIIREILFGEGAKHTDSCEKISKIVCVLQEFGVHPENSKHGA